MIGFYYILAPGHDTLVPFKNKNAKIKGLNLLAWFFLIL